MRGCHAGSMTATPGGLTKTGNWFNHLPDNPDSNMREIVAGCQAEAEAAG